MSNGQSAVGTTMQQRNVTLLALAGMAAGFSIGLLARESGLPLLLQFRDIADTAGDTWMNALRMTVIPLMVAYVVLAINSVNSARTAGKLGGLAMICFVSMLAAAAVLVLTVGAQVISMIPVDESTRHAFRSMGAAAETPAVAPSAAPPSIAGWLTSMVPANPFRAAVEDNFIAIIVSTVIFALAMLKIDPEKRQILVRFFEAAADTTGVVIGWIIYLLPIAAFALAFVIAADTGVAVATSVAYYVAALSGMLLMMMILLYPATALIAKVSLRRFISATAPALAVGAGTRSSIVALPAMLDGAENRLGVRREVSGFILPLAVSTFKLNPVISQSCEFMFFVAVFQLTPSPPVILSIITVTVLLAFASAGIPSGSKLLSWPIFLAMGVPVEALVVMKVVDAIPDIFKTTLNVTADMSATVIVQRFAVGGAPELAGSPALAPATE